MSDLHSPASDGFTDVLTFGCRLNIVESEVMRKLAQDALADASSPRGEPGMPNKTGTPSPILIVNTCAVTAEAERQARQAIRRAHRQDPRRPIIVTGCAAQLRPGHFAALPGVRHVLGNAEKTDPSTLKSVVAELLQGGADTKRSSQEVAGEATIQVSDIMAADTHRSTPVVTSFDGMERAFIEIQNGCNHRCTFCTIPFGRGNNRSAPVAQIIKGIQLVKSYNEIVLTGVDITDYGLDLPGSPKLGDLVRRIFVHAPWLRRLRLSSMDPVEIDPMLYTLIATEPRLLPHFHLSLQSGDEVILRRMKRRHTPEDSINCVAAIRTRRPGATFGADLIAGFPTETAAMFENTFNLIKLLGITHLHVFPYSPRPGTPAARMRQVPGNVIKSRAAALRELGDALRAEHMRQCVGTVQTALVENKTTARTDTYLPVLFEDPTVQPGSVISLFLEDYDETAKKLRGRPFI